MQVDLSELLLRFVKERNQGVLIRPSIQNSDRLIFHCHHCTPPLSPFKIPQPQATQEEVQPAEEISESAWVSATEITYAYCCWLLWLSWHFCSSLSYLCLDSLVSLTGARSQALRRLLSCRDRAIDPGKQSTANILSRKEAIILFTFLIVKCLFRLILFYLN